MLSVRKKDLIWEDYEDNKKCWWVSCNLSKTQIRKVPVPLFTEEISSFVNTQEIKSKNDNDLLFDCSYANYRVYLFRNGKKVIGKKLTPHSLRHSSATYYSRLYDGHMGLIADRYGWSYSSKELATYIRRSGAYQKLGAKKVFNNEVVKVMEENKDLKERLQKQEDLMNNMTKKMAMFDKFMKLKNLRNKK